MSGAFSRFRRISYDISKPVRSHGYPVFSSSPFRPTLKGAGGVRQDEKQIVNYHLNAIGSKFRTSIIYCNALTIGYSRYIYNHI